ncbi:MAG: helix-turn-helix domain-containing protein [Pirellulaceae bacterium]|nr:helix-turn-helix domain-containing protein [Pirellulaceae bacterium]
MDEHRTDGHELCLTDAAALPGDRGSPAPRDASWRARARLAYRMKLGRETISVDTVGFRILQFLAAHPYRAYTRRRIAAAVSSRRQPVAAESLDHHISVLRRQLGFFRDYIQTVPHIGYRFKA